MGEQLPVKKAADNENTYVEKPVGELRVSVRRLVEFLLREGDIDNRHQAGAENAMQEGSRIHRMLQKRMGSDYQAEVSLKAQFPGEGYNIVVEGRADGVLDVPEKLMIDEIKGTYRDLNHMKRPVAVHLAQAKCYAYLYTRQKPRDRVQVRMTYCNIETEDVRYFYEEYDLTELEKWFLELLKEYRKWSDFTWKWGGIRQASLEAVQFPFPYRDGQKDLVSYVYQTIYHRKKLFIEAPTGVGKTISTIFPAMKAMSKGMGERMFYLTAKTIARTVADDTIELLRRQGLRFKSIILTAKEKICFQEKMECVPDRCPYAKGHYDRVNDAIYDLITHEDRFSREKLEEYAMKHQVCPFEMGLDVSLFADAIICDYNYLFDPHVYLKRFFESGGGDYLFLIDEAHNLLERGREMYSAELVKEDFLSLKRIVKDEIATELEGAKTEKRKKKTDKMEENTQLTLELTGLSPMVSSAEKPEKQGKKQKAKSIFVREGYADKITYHLEKCNKELLLLKRDCETAMVVEEIDDFVNALQRLYACTSDYLSEQEEETVSCREELLDFFFEMAHFLEIYERVDEHYVKYVQMREDGTFLLKLFCVNPKENLKECMLRGRSSILFSATLLPIQYYKELLGGDKEDYEVYAKSVFDNEKRALFIANDVTTKFTRRSPEEFYNIARYINSVVSSRAGNYMVFCPSYAFMRSVYETFMAEFPDDDRECIMQQEIMSEEEKELFLGRFKGNEGLDLGALINMEIEEETEKQTSTLVGFCVLGGVFSEGIDLREDSLIGAVIVGTGLPQVGYEKELLKSYFDERGENGFDYAYRFPGMNKVLQAAGRVIRTQEDVGVITLLDERFLQGSYRKTFPREWEYYEVVNAELLERRLERFWDSWGKYGN
ncbi:MAG: ATP-dependent DNA helicase [Lachnospiraceae bacterium]|nr:ATP-dependent DNA helicase [Lachnospiraceae bacterium]